jgi:cell wall-associated NlpC family hydrolase
VLRRTMLVLTLLAAGAGAASAQLPMIGQPPLLRLGAPSAPAVTPAASDSSAPAAVARRPAPFAAYSASATALRDSAVALARSQIGRRYTYGGETPERGFDCSGLVRYISSLLDMRVPRTAAQQATVGARVARDTSQLLPGDLITFGNGRVSHVGIYVGNNRYVHASVTAGRVIESPLIRPPAPRLKPWQGVRRLFGADSTSSERAG